MLAVSVETMPEFTVTTPTVLFEGAYETRLFASRAADYDVSRDSRFLMLWRSNADAIALVQNWFEELKQRVPVD